MPVTFYSWEDSGAPQFKVTNNVSGAYQTNIIEIMDAILINGYGSKTALGWTKLMSSDVAGSDRAVYQNVSAYSENMNMIIQSTPEILGGISVQIADVVNSPEVYTGYSDAVSIRPSRPFGTSLRWFAVGDERTLIFILSDSYSLDIGVSDWDYYYISSFYAGDLIVQDPAAYPRCWALIGTGMYAKTLDTIGSAANDKGFLNFNYAQFAHSLRCRPFTQIPDEAWSTDPAMVYYPSLESIPNFSNNNDYLIRFLDEYPDQAKVRVPYYMAINHVNVFRLRGIYNMFPWLTNCDGNNFSTRNWAKVFTVDGTDYMAFFRDLNWGDSYYSPLTVYLQISGEWG
ncbi:hypothetical protein [Endozoicomonas sp. SESOKO1]|uniref:hypothetical protein n=1 Tax=Endozoicomonas sp. SESOKO1 TaxID=2828742 RepID=UPI0021491464|nr:hypothetical protein [Endozoicomonas sp. SESOKO1]